MENTIQELKKYDGQEINEEMVQIMLDNVYKLQELDNFKEKIIFDMLDDLYPFDVYRENEEKFNEQFDGTEVLPYELKAEFDEYILNKQFLEAEKLFVPISRAKYFSYYQNGCIQKEGYVRVVSLKYDKELGLLETSDCFS